MITVNSAFIKATDAMDFPTVLMEVTKRTALTNSPINVRTNNSNANQMVCAYRPPGFVMEIRTAKTEVTNHQLATKNSVQQTISDVMMENVSLLRGVCLMTVRLIDEF